MEYCDTDKVTVRRVAKEDVYDMVVNKHYAGRWTGSTDIFGIYYDDGNYYYTHQVDILWNGDNIRDESNWNLDTGGEG